MTQQNQPFALQDELQGANFDFYECPHYSEASEQVFVPVRRPVERLLIEPPETATTHGGAGTSAAMCRHPPSTYGWGATRVSPLSPAL